MNKLADAVRVTLGPKGRNVVGQLVHAPSQPSDLLRYPLGSGCGGSGTGRCRSTKQRALALKGNEEVLTIAASDLRTHDDGGDPRRTEHRLVPDAFLILRVRRLVRHGRHLRWRPPVARRYPHRVRLHQRPDSCAWHQALERGSSEHRANHDAPPARGVRRRFRAVTPPARPRGSAGNATILGLFRRNAQHVALPIIR